jgi:NADH:ubiquinone oxidoreductase subunit E
MYEHLASLTGARVTYTYGRIGGLARDLPAGWLVRLEEILVQYEEFIGRVHGLMDRNRIFIDRMRNVGVMSTADALSYGYTGPILRSTGVPRDLRRDTPYLAYAELDFEVPVGIKGDNYDRYFVRMREMDESVHMMRQLVDMLPAGPINVDDHRCTFPESARLHGDRVADQPLQAGDGRPAVPAGEVYAAHESPNGELGFYIVSTGGGIPYKVHVPRAELRAHGRRAQDARRIPARRHRADLRLDQHDRRRVRQVDERWMQPSDERPMKHLIPEFDKLKAALPAGFESSLVLPCVRRIQEDRGYVADSGHRRSRRVPGRPRASRSRRCCRTTRSSGARRSAAGTCRTCRNVSCSMRGAERLIAHIRKLGVAPGETTADGRFTLSTVECLGSCGTAPVVMVNDTYHES